MYSRRWLIAALAALGLAGGCSQFNTNLTNQTSSSFLAFLSPQTAKAGDPDFTITANGAGFVTGAIILWNAGPNQVQLATTFVSNAQLTATVPASDITAAGSVSVAVQIPGSAVSGASGTTATTTTEVSNVVNFTIQATTGALPVITSLSASTTSLPATPYCSPTGFTLTVAGSNFNSGSVVNWKGSPRATAFNTTNSSQLTASILPQDAAFPGTANVSVSNASGPSNSLPFTMTTPMANLPAPATSSLAPTSIKAGSATFTLVVTDSVPGSSFVPCSVVQWNGNARPTTYVSAAQLNATISAADVISAGSAQVTVFTLAPPAPGQTSSAVTFTISP
jgi:hypothetical protein